MLFVETTHFHIKLKYNEIETNTWSRILINTDMYLYFVNYIVYNHLYSKLKIEMVFGSTNNDSRA